MNLWYVFTILVWASNPPTMHQNFEARVMPVPYKTEAECRDSMGWILANAPRVPAPAPDTKIVYACILI